MLEIKATAISLEEKDLLELERIITDDEAKEALRFLKKVVYERIAQAQRGRLKSHLDTGMDAVHDFTRNNREH